MTTESPFIYKFESLNGNHYIYDVRTQRLLRVSKEVYDMVEDYGVLSKSDMISKWSTIHSLKKLRQALKEIENNKRKGFFSFKRFKDMIVPYDRRYLDEQIASSVGYLVLNITEACNMRCKYCAYSGTYKYERIHNNRYMADTILFNALKYYLSHTGNTPIKSISFYGGEPLLAFAKIIKVCKMIKGRGFEIHIDTNGLLLNNPYLIDALIRYDIFLQVSLDGPALCHDLFRVDINGKPTYSRIVKGLRSLMSRNPKYYKRKVAFQVTLNYKTDLIALNQFFEDNPLVQGHLIRVSMVNSFDTTFYDQFTTSDIRKYMSQYRTLKENYIQCRIRGIEPTALEKALFEKPLIQFHLRRCDEPYVLLGLNGSCIPGLRKIFVNTDGEFYPCERVMRAYNIGNVDKGIEIDTILLMANIYAEQSMKECVRCWAAKICGVCFSHSVKNNNFDISRKRENCQKTLKAKHTEIVTYATIMERNPKAFDFTRNMLFI